ncbi:291_t:CDS:2 [Paraglomus occultum]|uniref:291_t:CDS:1 n=1 Tax=Paraglomus occultum TaxID=144539 RepID=A0A9N9FU15_9GLOM|nr:291_t:CDS:2 [Paraglomus occultum]
MSLSFYTQLANNFGSLLEWADDFNTIIQVGKQPEIKSFEAHSVVLRARSEYFRTALSSSWSRKQGGKYIFEKPNISPKVFEIIIKYIYSGTLSVKDYEGEDMFGLLIAADEMLLEELIYPIQEHIIRERTKWVKENLPRVLDVCMKRDWCDKLRDHCINTLCAEPRWFFESDDFTSVEETTLLKILTCDNICLEEGQIWDYLIKWAIANTPNIRNNVSEWSYPRDFFAIRRTLSRSLPLIRYSQISFTDLQEKVKPYEKIFYKTPQVTKLFRFRHVAEVPFQLPEHEGLSISNRPLDSNIISNSQASLIALWIDGKTLTEKMPLKALMPMSYGFKLLYRGSRDGFSAKMFHNRCDNKGPTIVVVRIEKKQDEKKQDEKKQDEKKQDEYNKTGVREVIGGYNPIGWSSPKQVEWRETSDSFIFSMGDGNLRKANVERIQEDNRKQAIQLSEQLGPCFGFYDIKIIDEAHECKSNYGTAGFRYGRIRDKSGYFGVDDYEVFQVIKK